MNSYDLYDIEPGTGAQILEIRESDIKQRFLDLGMVPGTHIKCVGKNNGGDMKAYLIRGAVIAIRKADCRSVIISKGEDAIWD
jgi:Fe2+ transport system protein FeoA